MVYGKRSHFKLQAEKVLELIGASCEGHPWPCLQLKFVDGDTQAWLPKCSPPQLYGFKDVIFMAILDPYQMDESCNEL